MTKTLKKNTLTKTLLVSGTVLTCGMAAMSQSNVHIPNAHALGVNAKVNKLNTIQPAHFESSYQVPSDALPVKFMWTPGKTSVEGKTTGFTTATQGTNGQQVWAPANRPHSPMPLYDTDMKSGNKIRIKNAGYVVGSDGSSNSGQWIDLICEPNNEWNSNHSHPFHTGTAIGDSATIGDKADNNHSITFLTTSSHNNGIQWQITPVKAGTDQKVKIGTIAYWSDIDVFQGISENFSKDQVYWANTAGYLHDSGVLNKLWNTRFIYSNNQYDGQGMVDVDKTGYVGTGSGDNFHFVFASPFVKAGDTNGAGNDQSLKINGIGIWDFCPAYRYDIFGNFPNLKLTPPPSNRFKNPQKTVTDMDENKVKNDTLSLKERNYKYDITGDTQSGEFKQLVMTDTLPNKVTTTAGNVHVYNKAGKDVTGDFDINVQGQKVTATLKSNQKSNGDLQNTTLDFQINATSSVQGLGQVQNEAVINDGNGDLKTNQVNTITPPPPSVTKQVSVDNGKTFANADTPQTAAQMTSGNQDYTWRNNFKLSSYTNFKKIVFTDHMENIQDINLSNVHVYDWDGKDVTNRGKLTTAKNGDKQTDVIWTANSDYLDTVNKRFGNKSNETPTFHMDIKTNFKNASQAQKQGYWNDQLKRVIIPNKTTLLEGDNSGDVQTDSNLSHVTPPPSVTKEIKRVTDMDEKDVTNDSLSLKEHNYQYDIKADTYGAGKFQKLVMTDTLPNGVTTKASDIHVINKAGKDVTGDFDINVQGQNVTVSLKNDQLSNGDVENTTLDYQIKVASSLKGVAKADNTSKITDGDHNLVSNKVETITPPPPSVTKQVSVDGGKTFASADTPQTAASLASRPQDYTWRNNFKLSSYTNFTKIIFTDHMENIQKVDLSKVHVYDWQGKDVTAQGKLTTAKNGDKQTNVVWTANPDYIKTVNTAFGNKSDKVPTFHMDITTNIKDATDAQEADYYNKDLKKVIIPNQTNLIEGDNSGDVSVDSNKSHVTPPKPTTPSVTKQVAVEGTDPTKDDGWNKTLELNNHDQEYEYRTKFVLSKNFNFDGGNLILTDHFENFQKYGSVKIIDAQGKDISNDFTITTKKTSATGTDIVATVKNNTANKYDDNGNTIYMVIDHVTWKGATGAQEAKYMEHVEDLKDDATTKENAPKAISKSVGSMSSSASSKASSSSATSTTDTSAKSQASVSDDADPFKVGITVPNQSELVEHSAIPGYSFDTKTQHTYVNFDIQSRIHKYVEDDNDSNNIADPSGRALKVSEKVVDDKSKADSVKDDKASSKSSSAASSSSTKAQSSSKVATSSLK